MAPTGGHRSAIPRHVGHTSKTPAHPRVAETPIGKIRPVFEGFDLAETSDWLEPPTPGPSRLGNITLRTPGRRNRALAAFTPVQEVVEERSDILDTFDVSLKPVHKDDLYQRRVTEQARRTTRSPLPTDVVPTPSAVAIAERSRSRSTSAALSKSVQVHTPPPTALDESVPLAGAEATRLVVASLEEANATTAHVPERRQSLRRPPGLSAAASTSPVPSTVAPLRLPRAVHRTVVAIGSGGRTMTRAERAGVAGNSSIRCSTSFNKSWASSTTQVTSSSRAISATEADRRALPIRTPNPVAKSKQSSEKIAITEPVADLRQARPANDENLRPSTPASELRQPTQTPRRYASPALSEATLNGQPEDWDASMARSANGSTLDKTATPVHTSSRRDSLLKNEVFNASMSDSDIAATPSSADTSVVRRLSGRILGALSSFVGASPAVEQQPDLPTGASATEMAEVPQSVAKQVTLQQLGTPQVASEPDGRSPSDLENRMPNELLNTPRKESKRGQRPQRSPRAGKATARQPTVRPAPTRTALGPARSVNLPPTGTVASRQKRKAPPSPQKPVHTAVQHKRRAPPSPAKILRSAPPPTQATTNSFTAQALARLPKPGQGHAAVAKTTIRDAERARDLAVRRAVFERLGKNDDPPPPPKPKPRLTHPVRGSTPGAASRRRAEERALFDAQVAQRAAARAATEAEQERIRAEIEAEMDRQARRETVIRARPLPAMYRRRM